MKTKLAGQTRAIILIIKDYQVQLMLWESATLSMLDHYADFQEGQERFDQLLLDYSDYPIVILNDVIEESFRNETVVHVAATDRKALLERKLNYSFRNTIFRAARITGREDGGRRDDTVMLSAITKPELVNPWVDQVLTKKMAVQSISSVAYLAESYLRGSGVKSPEHLMVISLEEGTHLRQTYLRKGRVFFSRLTTLPTADLSALGENIYQESLQIRQYLERIKLFSYESPIEIRIFAPCDSAELAQSLSSSRLNSFVCFDTREEALSCNIDLKGSDVSGLYLFLANVLQKKRIENRYANFDLRRYFHLKLISQGLAIAGSVLVVVAMLLNTPVLSDTLDKRSLTEVVESQSAPLRAQYDRLTQGFPETPIDSKEMALVVETYETIKRQSHEPTEAIGIISQALEQAPDLQIARIVWTMQEKDIEQDTSQGFFGSTPPQPVVPGMEFTQALIDNRSSLHVLIDGTVFSPDSYREAQDQVLAFANALNEFPGLSVNPLKMPTDVRVDAQVFTTVGDEQLRAAYTLELIFEEVE